jgi:hypothetical protein
MCSFSAIISGNKTFNSYSLEISLALFYCITYCVGWLRYLSSLFCPILFKGHNTIQMDHMHMFLRNQMTLKGVKTHG